MPWTAGQRDALAGIIARINSGEKVTVVHGLAGTGKTTILAELKKHYFPDAFLFSKYGKACEVLRRKTNAEVQTIDSAIYNHRRVQREDGTVEFVKSHKDVYFPLIFLDETSVVGCQDGEKLLAKCGQLVAFGDPGQLEPIGDQAYFDKPNFELKEIVRQQADSPIIKQSRMALAGWYQDEGHPNFRVVEEESDELLSAADMVLCHTNAHREQLNFRMRALAGRDDRSRLYPGEPLMCLRNDNSGKTGLSNGSVVRVLTPWQPGKTLVVYDDVVKREITIVRPTVEWIDPTFESKKQNRGWLQFTPAYAVTVTKSQGSEWNSVLLFDGRMRDKRKTMYTGITRAVQRIVVVRSTVGDIDILAL